MKQKTITISMLKSENGEQRMTSLEIAELTGKRHCDVMRSIRVMESAWETVSGRKFALATYIDEQGKDRPCYSLTKTECLYIATKFNDEARARLVIRWKQLEEERQEQLEWQQWLARWGTRGTDPLYEAQRGQSPCGLLGCSDEEILNEADDIIGDELDELNAASDCCYTPSDIAKVFGMEGRDLNSFLADRGVIHWACGQWQPTRKFANRGLTENRCFIYHNRKGQRRTESRLVWTEKGRQMILDMLR